MPLFHRSRRYPPNINNSVRVDHEVPFDALWLQATSYDDEACCPRFGPHQLAITSRDILAFYNIERQPDLQLRLWHVASNLGRRHEFHKMVLIPARVPHWGMASCHREGWQLQTTYNLNYFYRNDADIAHRLVQDLMDDNWFHWYDDIKPHVHIGLFTDGEDFFQDTWDGYRQTNNYYHRHGLGHFSRNHQQHSFEYDYGSSYSDDYY
eukprot:TRINITY_DN8604_c0_g1_i3.p1 TRINITY_DN8604_c0_g1~~TRINITY_DN8604_c0_g1_i3.p1  ORF type:complete len:208 (+),score=19.37 TRINITY_DN8604_c0_g1_i3:97-720(+)